MNTECEEFLTPQDVHSSILQAHRRFINSEPFTSDSFDKTIGNISSTTDQFIISNENSVQPKQNETQFEDVSDGNTSHRKLQTRRSRSKSTRVSKGARCESEPSRLPSSKILNLFNKNKAIKRYVRSHIVHSVTHSSALKKILSKFITLTNVS